MLKQCVIKSCVFLSSKVKIQWKEHSTDHSWLSTLLCSLLRGKSSLGISLLCFFSLWGPINSTSLWLRTGYQTLSTETVKCWKHQIVAQSQSLIQIKILDCSVLDYLYFRHSSCSAACLKITIIMWEVWLLLLNKWFYREKHTHFIHSLFMQDIETSLYFPKCPSRRCQPLPWTGSHNKSANLFFKFVCNVLPKFLIKLMIY